MRIKQIILSTFFLISSILPGVSIYNAYAEGTLGTAQPLNVSPFTPGHQPGVAMRENGEAVAVWSKSFNGTTQAIHRPDRNAPWTVIATFGSQTGGGNTPSVVMNDAGDTVVAWGGANGVYVRFKRRGESTFQPLHVIEQVGVSPSQQTASAAINSNGDFVVAWKDVEGPPYENKTRVLFHPAEAAWPPSGFETVTDAHGHPFVALDDNRNIALFYERQYLEINDDPGPFAQVFQRLKPANGAWTGEVLISGATPYSGLIFCNSSFTGAPDTNLEGIVSNPKTGQIILTAAHDATSRAYKSFVKDGETFEGCIYNDENRQNFGLAKFTGTVASGVGGPQFIYEAPDYRNRTSKVDLNGNFGAVSFVTRSFGILSPTTPEIYVGIGSPSPTGVQSIYADSILVGADVAVGGEGTGFAVAHRITSGFASQEAFGFIKEPNGNFQIPISLIPDGRYSAFASNCKGDGLFVLLSSADSGDGKVYVVDYINAKASCDGSTETPVPTPLVTPVITPVNVDECPNDPNKISPRKCGCGNPEIDTNNDGIIDCGKVTSVSRFTPLNNPPIIGPFTSAGTLSVVLEGFTGATSEVSQAKNGNKGGGKTPKLTYLYEVTAKLRDSKAKCGKVVVQSKKNTVKLKKLLKGTYDISYKVLFNQGKKKAGATSSSPSAAGDVLEGKTKCPPKKKK